MSVLEYNGHTSLKTLALERSSNAKHSKVILELCIEFYT